MSSSKIFINKNNNFPYVYMGIHKITGHFYIGYRECNKVQSHLDIGKKYRTTSSSVIVKEQFNEFDWVIIAEFYTDTAKDDAYWFEQEVIKENIKNPLCLNKHYVDKALGHKKFCSSAPEVGSKISASMKGKMKGKTYDEIYGVEKATELRKKRSEHMSIIRRQQTKDGKPNPMQGKTHGPEAIEKIKLSRYKSIGKWCWITNGEINKKHRVGEELPHGFWKGRDPSFLKKK